MAAQPEVAELIAVNDGSTDGTAYVLAELAARTGKLRVLDAPPLPAGWVGKNHALWTGAQQARGEWLLFTDADTQLLPGAVARALADATRTGALLVSYSPGQQMETWWERAVIPFIYCWLAMQYSYEQVNSPYSRQAAANGQFLLIRRDAYDQVGGHAAVAADILEDVELARRVKQAALGIHFAPGEGIASTRMYSTFPEMWQGWTKNLYLLAGGRPRDMWGALGSIVPWAALVVLAFWPVSAAFGAFGLVLLAGRHAFYAAQLRRNRYSASGVIYYLAGLGFFCAALVGSWWRHRRGRVVWKGRVYPARTGT